MLKRYFFWLLLSFLLLNCCEIDAFSEQYASVASYKVEVDGEVKDISSSILLLSDRTYLPIRNIGEILNLYIEWDNINRTINVSNIGVINEIENRDMVFHEDKIKIDFTDLQIKIDGYIRVLNTPIIVADGISYLPLREVAEIFDLSVHWSEAEQTVIIYTKNNEEEKLETLFPFYVLDDNNERVGGYMDETGNIIIEPQYSLVEDFSNGLARIALKDGSYGYINTQGIVVIPCEFYYAENFSEGIAIVKSQKWEQQSETEENEDIYYYINTIGQRIIDEGFLEAKPFKHGIASVMTLSHKRILIDKEGNSIKQSDKSTFITKNYDYILYDDECVDFYVVRINDKWGVVDKYNNVIIDFQYQGIGEYRSGLFAIKINDKWGYIDINNNIIITPRFEYAYPFKNSLAVVGDEEKDFIIDKKGNTILIKSALRSIDFIYPNGVVRGYDNNNVRIYVNQLGDVIYPNIDLNCSQYSKCNTFYDFAGEY